jgi:hypothetical protein
MPELPHRSEQRIVVDKYLTEVSLLAKVLCPKAKVEATIESFEDEDGHVRIHPQIRAFSPIAPRISESVYLSF